MYASADSFQDRAPTDLFVVCRYAVFLFQVLDGPVLS
jgi:hypothetical protein